MSIPESMRSVGALLLSGFAFWLASLLQPFLDAGVFVGVDVPYLPAGVRLITAAVFGFWGCAGVFVVSALEAREVFPGVTPIPLLAVAAASGFSPLLALVVVRRLFRIDEQLLKLSLHSLLNLMALQSLVSALAHQAVFALTGIAPSGNLNLATMIVGDFTGCTIVVLIVALVWEAWRRKP